eukprot:1963585-Lingulodinium_polyedra.AAC.1
MTNQRRTNRGFRATDEAGRDAKKARAAAEIAKLKAQTRCNHCGTLGHWARECPRKEEPAAKPVLMASCEVLGDTGSNRAVLGATARPDAVPVIAPARDGPDGSNRAVLGATARPDAIPWSAAAAPAGVPEALEATRACLDPANCLAARRGLVRGRCSPGFGVLDTACGYNMIGAETLEGWQQHLLAAHGLELTRRPLELSFSYGNGGELRSSAAVQIPIALGGRCGVLTAAVVDGHAPLLLSHTFLAALDAVVGCATGRLRSEQLGQEFELVRDESGLMLLPLWRFPAEGWRLPERPPGVDIEEISVYMAASEKRPRTAVP